MTEVLERPLIDHREPNLNQALRRVLIVEDSTDIRNLLRFMLQSTGVQVMAVGDGQSALELIQTWPAPDVIIMDRMLPYVDGDELVRAIRNEPTWSSVPVVVISAKAQTEEIARMMSLGADEYITKPFSAASVLKVVEKHFPN